MCQGRWGGTPSRSTCSVGLPLTECALSTLADQLSSGHGGAECGLGAAGVEHQWQPNDSGCFAQGTSNAMRAVAVAVVPSDLHWCPQTRDLVLKLPAALSECQTLPKDQCPKLSEIHPVLAGCAEAASGCRLCNMAAD